MILGLLLLAAALLVYFEFILPAYDSMQSVKAERLGLESFLGGQKPVINRIKELISAYQGQDRLQQAVSLALPTEQDSAGALAQLYGLAQSSGLNFLSATISVTAVEDIARTRGLATLAGTSVQKPVGTVTIQMRLGGAYEGLKSFLGRLETNIRIFDIKSLTVQPVSAAQKSAEYSFTYDLEVATYYQSQ